MAFKNILKNVRIWIVIIALIFAVVAIHPVLDSKGAAIRNVIKDSAAEKAGIESPDPNTAPTKREVITSINNQLVNNIQDYEDIIKTLQLNQTVRINTNKGQYVLRTLPLTESIVLNETEWINKTFTEDNQTYTHLVLQNKTETKIIGMQDIGLKVYEAPTSNLRKGLDLQGGTRVLLQPENETSAEDMEIILENMKQRLNVFGLSDVIVKSASDLPVYLGGTGMDFIIVEIAGANEEEVKDLLSQQGKFEAKIANKTVFKGGNDITYVCRSSDCSGIDPTTGCGQNNGEWFCSFRFSISLNPEAAKKQAEATKDLDIVPSETEMRYLSEKLQLFLDDEMVDELNIAEGLKGQAVTEIEISGSGAGITQQAAVLDSLDNMKRLQTILITGSLPVKLNIVKTDSISPTLGKEFIKNSVFFAVLAMIGVALVIVIIYRKLVIAIPILITMISEIVLLLGTASLIGWNLDLAAIAGIIISVGTGVDDQIVITDETLRGEQKAYSLKERIKRAFFIIMAAYFVTVVAMLPLWFAGAGLLKGFALTTIIGVSIGVFITRPAFASLIELLLKE